MTLRNLFLAIALCATAPAALAVELHLATDRQILDELAFRLRGGGGGGGDSAFASYTCDPYGNLRVSLVGDTATGEFQLGLGNRNACQSQATPLVQTRARIDRLTLIALCDPYGNMKRLALRPEGTVQEVDSTYFGNLQACLQQAGPINGGR